MFCTTCSTQNLETSKRCIKCGDSLIGAPVGGTESFRESSRFVDMRIYGGVGGFLGGAVGVLLANTVLQEFTFERAYLGMSIVACAGVGTAIGRFIASRKI